MRLRGVEPYLCKITHESFVAVDIILPSELEKTLLMKFDDFQI